MKKIISVFCAVVVIVLYGCSTARRATINTSMIERPSEGNALVSFVMGHHKHPVSIWDGKEMLGLLMPSSIFQAEVVPGKHLFLGVYGRRVFPLEADIAADKHYVIRSKLFHGAGMRFMPVRRQGIHLDQIKGWFEHYRFVHTNLSEVDHYRRKRQKLVDRFIDHYIYSMYPEYTLHPDDGFDEPLMPQYKISEVD